ncbi:PTH1 family peptidyl-tRNA hydrolase [Keratinibaculum paraultunense]|uniref:Peptidyl-tRNA hydrolase n=1 Tax=Keratinibaculum paraultunense TaxID=1278232 RepID=A0A4R3KT19_9FIRM|nr:aminoacyl-tRNA hydrolase [Keratinibaculum paraultunense]QQY79497.1 aminoacyl-tRNA hydrolase [Keratinibaculum paraultunense]TCS88008.1 PTH1 family peptidyl-tRNA hydrolase [Keratinibaculum paraultunense]
MFAVVGLGNPGRNYSGTRHNVGFKTVELLADRNNINLNKIKFKSIYGEGIIGGEKVILLKPQTYMNNSGIAVLDLYNFYKIPLENIIVIVDDVDIEFGTIRIRKKGSDGGHNGLKSIIYQLGSQDFPRIKIGIGKKREEQDLADFVLSKFSKEEKPYIEEAVLNAALAVETIITCGIDNAMNKFNIKKKEAQE